MFRQKKEIIAGQSWNNGSGTQPTIPSYGGVHRVIL